MKTLTELEQRTWNGLVEFFRWMVLASILVCMAILLRGCEQPGWAQEVPLTASWYSVESLKKEGTWRYSHGRMANNHIFSDTGLTCATRLFPLGSKIRVCAYGQEDCIIVKVTDKIGKRFARTRIDLSKRAFKSIANLNQGLIRVRVERI